MTVGRFSQLPLEVLTASTAIKGRFSQLPLEVLTQETDGPNAKISQAVVEVLCSTPPLDVPTAPTPGSEFWQVMIEQNLNAETGKNNLLFHLISDGATSIPADNNAKVATAYSSMFPVKNISSLVYGGSLKWVNSIDPVLPAGVFIVGRIGIQFFDAALNLVDTFVYLGKNGRSGRISLGYWEHGFGGISSTAGGDWSHSPAVPSDVPPSAVYAQLYCMAAVIVNSAERGGAAFDTGNADPYSYANIRFDNLYVIPVTDPSKSLEVKGSTVPTLSTPFTYTSTSSSVTIKWNGLGIYRSDGTVTYPTNGSKTISGLSASTTYYFYPYWDDELDVLTFVSGGVGTSGAAFTSSTAGVAQAQAQILRSRIPLSVGPLSVATTSSGVGGGSSGGSGRGCLREGMLVRSKEKGLVGIETLERGDLIWSREGWTEVQFVQISPCDEFVRFTLQDGSIIEASSNHPFTLPNTVDDGDVVKRSSEISLNDLLYVLKGVCPIKSIEVVKADDRKNKVTISCYPCHEFYAGQEDATILSHNIFVNS